MGIEAEADKVKKVCSELKGKNLEELMEEGELMGFDWISIVMLYSTLYR